MAWLWWLGGALLLGIVEMLTLDLIFLMLAVGALAGAVAAGLGVSVTGQIVTAAVVALLMLFAMRPWLLRHLRSRTTLVETNAAGLVGREAVVVATTDTTGGRVKLAGEVWSARTEGPGVLPPGEPVRVVRIDGATAVVQADVGLPQPEDGGASDVWGTGPSTGSEGPDRPDLSGPYGGGPAPTA